MSAPRAALRLVLCDDHLMLLEALKDALTAHGHLVVGLTTEPDAAVDLVSRLQPDVCILDVSFPDGDGVTAAERIQAVAPSTKVMLLSAALTPDIVRYAAEVGVRGFARKDDSLAQILDAIDRLVTGQITIDADLLRGALQPHRHPVDFDPSDPSTQLTTREREVLDRIIAGDSTAAISASLHISESTARSHVQNVLMKLGVHTRIQAVALVTSKTTRRLHGVR
jgi:two-component system nitrate/nitrite response regulator NarL